jgi:hypothetical protein
MGVKGNNDRLQGQLNQLVALEYIHDYGWLRAAELGRLMWPRSQHFAKQGERLARQLVSLGMVIPRKLPAQQGRALVLSEYGAKLLRNDGWLYNETWAMSARSGKDWGKTDGDQWEPPGTWRHDLIATSLLTLLKANGLEVMPERRIKGTVEEFDKYPDGFIKTGNHVAWLEVEQARKTGSQMASMAKHVALATQRQIKPIAGASWRPTLGAVAFPHVVDERGHVINHRRRVINALHEVAKVPFDVMLIELHMAPGCFAVKSYKGSSVRIDPDNPPS